MTNSVAKRLEDFYEPEDARLWLSNPHQLLGGRRPVDLITEGDTDAVLALIDQLRDASNSQDLWMGVSRDLLLTS